jgi:hypothetical protein
MVHCSPGLDIVRIRITAFPCLFKYLLRFLVGHQSLEFEDLFVSSPCRLTEFAEQGFGFG